MRLFRFRGVSITREGIYYVLVLLFIITGALIRNFQLLMILACMMVGPLVYNMSVVFRALKRLRLERKLPHSICAGDPLLIELKVENTTRKNTYAIVVEDQVRLLEGGRNKSIETVDIFFARIGKRATVVSTYRGQINQRGKYRIGPLRTTTAFPLGLLRNTYSVDVIDELIVYPKMGRLTPAWNRLIEIEQTGFAASRRQHGLLEGDFYGIRDWRAGDPRQWIHWRTSAKRGQLVVRQFEKQNQQDISVIVDAWIPKKPSDEDYDRVETAISMAAAIVSELAAIGGCHLMLVCNGTKTSITSGTVSQSMIHEALRNLAILTPVSSNPMNDALSQTLQESKHSSKVFILTPRYIDVSDTEMFEEIWRDTQLRSDLGRVNVISVAEGNIDSYFLKPSDNQDADDTEFWESEA
ncbi:MAG: DUF58 domain-containing protein [Pirellulales bacterium]